MTLRIGFNARCLVEPQTRGLTRYAVNLLKALAAHNNLELVLFSDADLSAQHLQGLQCRVVVTRAPRETLWEAYSLPRALRMERIDVFHAPADRGLPLMKPCPCVVTIHDSYERTHWRSLFSTPRRKYWYWKNELANRFLADAVITVSDTTLRDLVTLKVASAARLHRIYLAPAAEFSSVASSADLDTLRRLDVPLPYLLYVGGYDPRKNVDALIRAFDRARLQDYCLVISAQKSREFKNLVNEWRSLRCFNRLRLIEAPVEDIPALYRHAAFFVNPSLWESFSFQVVEAMACGTPLIASNRKAIPEIAGEAALLIDSTSTSQLATAMETLAADPGLRGRLSREGFARVQRFSWTETAKQTIQVYEAVSCRGGGA